MRAFNSHSYELIGFRTVSIDGEQVDRWVFKTKPDSRIKDFQTTTLLAVEAKWVVGRSVYFLKSNGSIEDRSRESVALPAYSNL